jgi:hypothetical protein
MRNHHFVVLLMLCYFTLNQYIVQYRKSSQLFTSSCANRLQEYEFVYLYSGTCAPNGNGGWYIKSCKGNKAMYVNFNNSLCQGDPYKPDTDAGTLTTCNYFGQPIYEACESQPLNFTGSLINIYFGPGCNDTNVVIQAVYKEDWCYLNSGSQYRRGFCNSNPLQSGIDVFVGQGGCVTPSGSPAVQYSGNCTGIQKLISCNTTIATYPTIYNSPNPNPSPNNPNNSTTNNSTNTNSTNPQRSVLNNSSVFKLSHIMIFFMSLLNIFII